MSESLRIGRGCSLKCEHEPADQIGDPAEGRDHAELGDVGEAQDIEAAGKDEIAEEKGAPLTREKWRAQADKEHHHGVHEMVEDGCLPIREAVILGEHIVQTMSAKCAEADREKSADAGDA